MDAENAPICVDDFFYWGKMNATLLNVHLCTALHVTKSQQHTMFACIVTNSHDYRIGLVKNHRVICYGSYIHSSSDPPY